MEFHLEPKTVQIKHWSDVKVDDEVLLFGEDTPAKIRRVDESYGAIIEFDWEPTRKAAHDCRGAVPSRRGYFVMYPTLLRKIIE